jgi:hypothetical protein
LLEKSSSSQNSVPSHGFDTKQESIGMQWGKTDKHIASFKTFKASVEWLFCSIRKYAKVCPLFEIS